MFENSKALLEQKRLERAGVSQPVAPVGNAAQFSDKQQKLIDQAKHVLQENEIILDLSTGMIQVRRMGSATKRNGTILVTDRRVILFTKKLGGYEMNDHVYGLLTALDYKKGMMSGNMTFAASGDRTHVSMIPTAEVERVAKAIRSRMAAAHDHGRADTNQGAADEILKLSKLHTAGILTDEEFTAKKRQLLGL